jgi:nicotinamide riboside transporter PnuC
VVTISFRNRLFANICATVHLRKYFERYFLLMIGEIDFVAFIQCPYYSVRALFSSFFLLVSSRAFTFFFRKKKVTKKRRKALKTA